MRLSLSKTVVHTHDESYEVLGLREFIDLGSIWTKVVLKLGRRNLACVSICNFQLLFSISGPAGRFPIDMDAVNVDRMSLKVRKLYIQRE
jgi:hypothetical protein